MRCSAVGLSYAHSLGNLKCSAAGVVLNVAERLPKSGSVRLARYEVSPTQRAAVIADFRTAHESAGAGARPRTSSSVERTSSKQRYRSQQHTLTAQMQIVTDRD